MTDELLKAELQEMGRRIRDARVGIATFLEQSAERHVYWVEQTGKTAQYLSLNAAPVDIAPVLRRMLFRENCSCVMTSATLAVGRPDLAYFRERIGATEAQPLAVRQPVQFREADEAFHCAEDAGPAGPRLCDEALAKWIGAFCETNAGTALFCSPVIAECSRSPHRMEKFFADEEPEPAGARLGDAPETVAAKFKSTPRSVLFGTDSFWMGVDVPGDALSNVIITRLPFAVPDHPLIEAKLELIASAAAMRLRNIRCRKRF